MSTATVRFEISAINHLATQLMTGADCAAASEHVWSQFMTDLALEGFTPGTCALEPDSAMRRCLIQGRIEDPHTQTELDLDLTLWVYEESEHDASWVLCLDANTTLSADYPSVALCYAALTNIGWSLKTPDVASLSELQMDSNDEIIGVEQNRRAFPDYSDRKGV